MRYFKLPLAITCVLIFVACHQETEEPNTALNEGSIPESQTPPSSSSTDESSSSSGVPHVTEASGPILVGAKAEVDQFLRDQGLEGLPAIARTIRRALREERVRVGPLKTAYYTIYEGYWLIAEDLTDEQKRDALTWLACSELGVPRELRERLIEQQQAELTGAAMTCPAVKKRAF